LNLDTWPETMSASHFILSFTQCRDVWKGHYQWWNMVFSVRPRIKTTEHAVENTEFTPAKKSTRLGCRSRPCLCVSSITRGEFTMNSLCKDRQTVNQQCYREVLTRLQESVQRKRPRLWPDKLILHHDNAPSQEFASSWLRTPLQKWTIHLIHLT
jgi:hypothetical protein